MSEWFWIRDTLVVPGQETVAKATEVGPLLALYGSLSLCLSFGGLSARRAATPVVSAHDGGGWSGSGTSPHQHNHEWHLQPRRDQWPVHLNGPVQGFWVKWGLSCVIGPFGRQGPAATLRQHCPQMTQRRCTPESPSHWSSVRFPDVSGAVAYILNTGFRVKGNAADNSANTHCGPSVKTCQTHLKVKQA